MADFTGGSVTQGAGVAGSVQTAANFGRHFLNQADVGREVIISVARTNGNGGLPDSVLTTVRNAITQAGGSGGTLPSNTGDAFTVAAIGTADGSAILNTAAAISADTATTTVYMRVQGTGTFDTTDATAGISNLTVTKIAEFKPAT